MAWTLVDEKHANIATVTAPTGNIEWPAAKDAVVGQTLPFVWLGRNSNPVNKTMLFQVDVRNPRGDLKHTQAATGDIPAGGQVLNKINVVLDEAGVWRADAYLYVYYVG